jgi:DNA-binding transcriptional ArsR family regulator
LPALNEDELREAARTFDALGSQVRLKILILVGETQRPLHIKAVAKALKMDYAALYRQVKVLQERGLLDVYEVGRSRVLSFKDAELLRQVVDTAKKMIHQQQHSLTNQ